MIYSYKTSKKETPRFDKNIQKESCELNEENEEEKSKFFSEIKQFSTSNRSTSPENKARIVKIKSIF